jgi:hypothetical protein
MAYDQGRKGIFAWQSPWLARLDAKVQVIVRSKTEISNVKYQEISFLLS